MAKTRGTPQPVALGERQVEILSAAARHFALYGFGAASMRAIAADAGLLAGSIYHHFASKDDMLVEAYRLGVDRIIAATDAATYGITDGRLRLEAACVAQLEALLADDPLARLLPLDLRPLPVDLRRKLVVERDRYERRFIAYVKGLGITDPARERMIRMTLLGALNWTPTWFRRGGETPATIARSFVRLVTSRAVLSSRSPTPTNRRSQR